MKKVTEMTTEELKQRKEVMETIDSPEAKKLLDQINNELDRRKAEAEAKRKEMEAKKAEMEAKRQAEIDKEYDTLVEKQKSVLGKCYKKVFYDTNYLMPTVHYTVYYKVTGVYDNKAVVSFVKKYEHSEMVSKAVTYVNIDDLLNKNEHYEAITRKEFNDIYAKSNLTFESLSDVFNRFLQFPF